MSRAGCSGLPPMPRESSRWSQTPLKMIRQSWESVLWVTARQMKENLRCLLRCLWEWVENHYFVFDDTSWPQYRLCWCFIILFNCFFCFMTCFLQCNYLDNLVCAVLIDRGHTKPTKPGHNSIWIQTDICRAGTTQNQVTLVDACKPVTCKLVPSENWGCHDVSEMLKFYLTYY